MIDKVRHEAAGKKAKAERPGITIVEAKPPEYLRLHHRIVEAVEDCMRGNPVSQTPETR